MSQSKPSFLLVFVSLVLAAGALAYVFVLKPVEPVVVPVVERLSEVEVTLSDEKRVAYEQGVIDLSAQIAEREAAGTYALDLYFTRGITYQRLGKLQLAFGDLTTVTAGDPGNETAWNNLGDIVIDMGDVMVAESYYQKAIEQDPSEVAYNKLYRYYTTYRLADRDEYIPVLLNLALTDNPGDVAFYVKLGRWYVEHGDKDNAVLALRQAAVLSPDNEAVRDELQKALAL